MIEDVTYKLTILNIPDVGITLERCIRAAGALAIG
jgi:hypothetical protein